VNNKVKTTIYLLAFFLGLTLASSASASITIRPALNLGLVGYWAMDEGYGNKAYDQSGNRNTGTVSGSPTWVDGKLGKALDFDGVDDYVNVGSNVGHEGASAVTVSLWAKFNTAQQAANEYLMGQEAAGPSNTIVLARAGYPYERMAFMVYVTGTGATAGGVGAEIADTNWHHFVGTYDGTTVKLYIDTVVRGDTPALSGSIRTESSGLAIGAVGDSGGGPTPGLIDEVRIYNRALSAEEIRRLYNLTKPKILAPSMKGLVGYWSFEEGSGTKAGDMSGNGNNGTLSGSTLPTWTDGKRGKALSFNGTSDYVDLGNGSSLNFASGQGFSFSAWVKTSDNYGQIVSFRNSVSGDPVIDLSIGENGLSANAGHFLPLMRYDDLSGSVGFTSTTDIADNTWHFVSFVYNPSTQKIYAYVDNSSWNIVQTATGTITTAVDRAIGAERYWVRAGYLSVDHRYLNGLIDEVRIYNRALSATEVANLYQSSGRKTTINSSQNTQLTSGLVGLWSFNGPDISGSLALDRSGQGNNGTIVDAIPAIGKVGQALSFNAISKDWVRIGNILPTSAYTKTAWVYANTTGGGTNIVSGFNGSCCATGTAFWVNGADFLAAGHNNSYSQVQENAANFPLNSWHFVGVTYDSNVSGGTLTLYRNGSQVGSTASISPPTGGYVTIGMFGDIGGSEYNPWDGKIDEVRIYNRALSAEEIKRLYNLGK